MSTNNQLKTSDFTRGAGVSSTSGDTKLVKELETKVSALEKKIDELAKKVETLIITKPEVPKPAPSGGEGADGTSSS